MKFKSKFLSLVFVFIYGLLNASAADVKSPEYWKNQALKDIIPFWEKTIDREYGGFYTNVSEDGSVSDTADKYTRMHSRVLYGFTAAYLLSGEDKYLDYAKHAFDFMEEFCYDRQNGGWHTSVDARGEPNSGYKNMFDITYGNLGPVYYFFATGNKQALKLVSETHERMIKYAFDTEYGGFFSHVGEDWRRTTSSKSFNAQIDTFTAYLLYYYLATRGPELLKLIKTHADVVLSKMVDKKSYYVGENFSQEWEWDDSTLWAGHNLKTGWVLTRVYNLTSDKKYLSTASGIAKAQINRLWDRVNGGWYFKFSNDSSKSADTVKDWWTQQEGSMLMLSLYPLSAGSDYLDKFEKTSLFWDKYFIDRKYGECRQSLTASGEIINAEKGDYYKSAYHTMEQALFNYLYLNLYVHKTDAELYFRFDNESDETVRYLKPVESPLVKLKSVSVNGEEWKDFDAKECSVKLPKGGKMRVKAVFAADK